MVDTVSKEGEDEENKSMKDGWMIKSTGRWKVMNNAAPCRIIKFVAITASSVYLEL